jgi:hypothetical protein
MRFRFCRNGGLPSAVFCALLLPMTGFGQTIPLDQKTELHNNDLPIPFDAGFLRCVNSIDGKDIRKYISALASDSLEGRGSGSKGFNKAAGLTAAHFERHHFQKFGNSYFQYFKIDAPTLRKRIFVDELTGDSAVTENIAATWEGTTLKNEFVVITAHLDHLGKKQDSVYYGANDNASGVSVILKLAELIDKNKLKPKRSIVFILFSGEEAGLRGSQHFVEHPVMALERIKFQINLDLVGSGKQGIMLQGGDHYPREEAEVKMINENYFHFELGLRVNSPNSDHFFFNAAGVPAFFVYAYNGTIPYHSPNDTADKIDTIVLENVAKFVFVNVWHFAN